MQITQKRQGPKCSFHGRAMKDYRCKFLLEYSFPYILSERISQDNVENYFGRQCAIGRRCDNPTVRDFGYNNNTIKLQYSVRPIAGNVQGSVSKLNEIITEPLPKKKG